MVCSEFWRCTFFKKCDDCDDEIWSYSEIVRVISLKSFHVYLVTPTLLRKMRNQRWQKQKMRLSWDSQMAYIVCSEVIILKKPCQANGKT